MKTRLFFGIIAVFVLALSGCITYTDEPFEPFSPNANVFVFTVEDGFTTYHGFKSRILYKDTQNSAFPFELGTFSSGDSLIQELRYAPSSRVVASGYALPEDNSPGQLYELQSFSEYYDYYGNHYRKPSRLDFNQVEIVGQPISETELDFPYMWGKMIKNPFFTRDLSSENVRIGLARFIPFTNSDDSNGSTYVFITYTY